MYLFIPPPPIRTPKLDIKEFIGDKLEVQTDNNLTLDETIGNRNDDKTKKVQIGLISMRNKSLAVGFSDVIDEIMLKINVIAPRNTFSMGYNQRH